MKSYRSLQQQVYKLGEFSIVPIRSEDRFQIMRWRNEQIYHLRQHKVLTIENQNAYFENVISKIFDEDKPDQILFSFLKAGECIGYGGLVHINWRDKNAEISFMMETSLEVDHFESNWIRFLSLVEKVAWTDLNLHKIYTYAFDIRPKLYSALEKAGFAIDAVLSEHCIFEDEFKEVKIHSKLNKGKELRYVQTSDFQTTFGWVNDPAIRKYSFNKKQVSLREHANWFFTTLENPNIDYYLFEVQGTSAGSIRFDVEEDKIAKINYLLDPNFMGKGLGSDLLKEGINFLKKNRPTIIKVYGHVFKENIGSVKIFEKLSFHKVSEDASELKFEKLL